MRDYSIYSNSYQLSSNNINKGSLTVPNTNRNSTFLSKNSSAPSKNSSFPSNAKKQAIVLQSVTRENEENIENSNVNTSIVNQPPRSIIAPSLKKGLSCRIIGEPIPDGGACHLCYEPDSSGRLVEHYSTTQLQGMATVGRWTPGNGKKIAGFKFKRNAGRNVLIGNCSAGVLGRKNYCNGFCQFVKSAKMMNGSITLYDVPTGLKAMPVDVYLYYDDNRSGHQTVKLVSGEAYTTAGVLAICCLPKGARFYERETVDLLKWLHDAEKKGYSSKC